MLSFLTDKNLGRKTEGKIVYSSFDRASSEDCVNKKTDFEISA